MVNANHKMVMEEEQLLEIMAKRISLRQDQLNEFRNSLTDLIKKEQVTTKNELLDSFSSAVDYAKGDLQQLEDWNFFDYAAKQTYGTTSESKTIFGHRGTFMAKIVIAGDGAVGKTSIRRRFFGKKFQTNYLQTIGADFSTSEISVDYGDTSKIKMQIWDIAGQPRFNLVRTGYYRGASGALIVYDITNLKSFINIVQWIVECWAATGKPIPIIIIGNKQDLEDERRVKESVGKKVAAVLNKVSTKHKSFRILYMPTSAKSGLNVQKAFELLGFSILEWRDRMIKRVKQD